MFGQNSKGTFQPPRTDNTTIARRGARQALQAGNCKHPSPRPLLSLPSRKAHTRTLFPKSLRHGTAWPLCWLSTSRRERRDRLALSQACAPRTPCLFKPPSHFTTLLLGGYLSGKHADSLRNVEPDPDVTSGFLFFLGYLLCARHSARSFAHQPPCSPPSMVERVSSPPCVDEA